ncbi:MAG: hypothetical protein C5B51_31880 [Terriglobia bacterium]|nr:MAG: hypothetical protein C5B51_31880 [Terriglobia bacterium]
MESAVEPNLDQERRRAHELLDLLSAEKLNAVRSLLEVMVEPLARSLAAAAVEEEEITPETAAALDGARASLARGEGIPHEEILRELPRRSGSRSFGRRKPVPMSARSYPDRGQIVP